MKKEFFDFMDKIMAENPDVYLLMIGLGYPRVSEFLRKYPERAFNTEASEQTALDIAVGLALGGKIPFVYTITPFLFRGWETIRLYINHQKLNVKLVGVGRDDDYSRKDGFSHYAGDIREFINLFTNIIQYWPMNNLSEVLELAVINNKPTFINIKK